MRTCSVWSWKSANKPSLSRKLHKPLIVLVALCGQEIQRHAVGWWCECERPNLDISHCNKSNSLRSADNVESFLPRRGAHSYRIYCSNDCTSEHAGGFTVHGVFPASQRDKMNEGTQWNVVGMNIHFSESSTLSRRGTRVFILNAVTNLHLHLSHFARLLCKATNNQSFSTGRPAVITITVRLH